jgi:TolA-binding protein
VKHTCQPGRGELGGACLACVADGRRVAEVRTVMRSDDALDDVARARVLSRLERRLADLSGAPDMAPWQLAERSGAGWRGRLRALARRRWVPVAASLAAAAALALLWPRHAPVPQGSAAAAAPGGAVSELVVPAGARARASIADRARITLVGGAGPARLAVTSVAADAIDLQLDDGLLLANYHGDGPSGPHLRIHAPGAIIEVTGTLFAVDAHDGTSEVSVAHGAVVVLAGPRRQIVAAGETWRPGDPTPHPLAAELAAELARHDAAAPLAASPATAPAIALAPPAAPHAIAAQAATAMPGAIATPAATAMPGAIATPAATATPGAIATPAATATPGAIATAPSRPTATPRAIAPAPTHHGASAIPDDRASSASSAAPAPAAAATAVTARATPPPAEVAPPEVPPEVAPAADADAEIETPEVLYARAERALRAKRDSEADATLAELVARYPRSALADAALYDRAQLAYRGRGWSRARAALDTLLARRPSSFTEPAAYLACRIAVETSDGEAVACLEQFRRAHPDSPHDAEALALLAGLAQASGGCGAARPLLSQYLDRYPRGHFAADARARLRTCEKAPR